jgi:hypothetical protein
LPTRIAAGTWSWQKTCVVLRVGEREQSEWGWRVRVDTVQLTTPADEVQRLFQKPTDGSSPSNTATQRKA